MKVQIEIDCTPDEARTFLGLPDVNQANDVYMDALTKAMKGVSNPDQLQHYAKQLAPMGQVGLKLFQSFVEGAQTGGKTGGTSKNDGQKSGQDAQDKSE